MYLNEATLLNNIRRRYKKDHIYVGDLFDPLCLFIRCNDILFLFRLM